MFNEFMDQDPIARERLGSDAAIVEYVVFERDIDSIKSDMEYSFTS